MPPGNSTITDILHHEFDGKLGKFRNGLFGKYRIGFDDLIAAAYSHRLPEALASFLQPIIAFLLSGWLEDHIKLMEYREKYRILDHDVTRLRAEVENLKRKQKKEELQSE
jgi:DNA/RNA-binding domain of Phe-tRNA-synthetase-like protein